MNSIRLYLDEDSMSNSLIKALRQQSINQCVFLRQFI